MCAGRARQQARSATRVLPCAMYLGSLAFIAACICIARVAASNKLNVSTTPVHSQDLSVQFDKQFLNSTQFGRLLRACALRSQVIHETNATCAHSARYSDTHQESHASCAARVHTLHTVDSFAHAPSGIMDSNCATDRPDPSRRDKVCLLLDSNLNARRAKGSAAGDASRCAHAR